MSTAATDATAETAITREELHFRRIDMRGFRRSDGLYEVEGRVTDRKRFDFQSPHGFKHIPAGEPIHDMGVRLAYDTDMTVREVATFTDSAPYGDCFDAGRALQVLVGERMVSGWSAAVRRLLSGATTCTHLKELLIPMGTVAYQTLSQYRFARPHVTDAEGRPVKLDSCYAYARHRDVVRRVWPDWYIAPVEE